MSVENRGVTPDEMTLGDMNMDSEFGDSLPERPVAPARTPATAIAELDSELPRGESVTVSSADYVRMKQAADLVAEHQRVTDVVTEFLANHKDDYTPTPKNGQVLERYFMENGLPVTPETVEEAFQELNAAGAFERPRAAARQTISGLPERSHRVPQRDVNNELEEKIHTLPIEEARDLILREFHKAKRKSGSAHTGSYY